LCFPPARRHVWELVARGFAGAGISPVKTDLNGTIPALVKSSVASSGTRGELAARSCCFDSKKAKKASRTSIMGYSHLGKIVAIIAKKGLIKEIRREREFFPFALSLSKGNFIVPQNKGTAREAMFP
jgi:hypothetical protein